MTVKKTVMVLCSLFLMTFSLNAIAAESVTYTFDDWDVTCFLASDAADDASKTGCSMIQRGIDQKSGRMLYQIGIRTAENTKQTMLEVVTPLGVMLKGGVKLEVEDDQIAVLPFISCTGQGCIAQIPLDERLKIIMKRGMTGNIKLKDVAGKDIPFPISFKGFIKALEKLEAQNR